ncbi:MAG: TrmH family RNA methyltransferase [Acutalibacteraceae bacterium]
MSFASLDSVSNDKIKQAVKLRESAKYRRECGRFFLEGLRLCRDAAESEVQIFYLFFTEEAYEKYTRDIDFIAAEAENSFIISPACKDKLSDTKTSQGVFLICGFLQNAAETEIDTSGKYIALENIQDPANLGAVCRTAEALGISGAVLCGCCDIYNPKAQRAAMGSLLRLKIIITQNLPELLTDLKTKGMTVLSTTPDSEAEPITKVDMSGGVIAVIGNEGNGVTEQTESVCRKITIPMKGRAESLNASMAAAVTMWEIMR